MFTRTQALALLFALDAVAALFTTCGGFSGGGDEMTPPPDVQPPVEPPPMPSAPANLSVELGSTLPLAATVPEGSTLSVMPLPLPGGMTLASGAVAFTPRLEQVRGDHHTELHRDR